MTGSSTPRPDDPIQRLPVEVKSLRWGLFVLTVLSAAAALFVEPVLSEAVGHGRIDPRWLFFPLGCFGVFLCVYAVDRWFLVRRRSYPPGRAFFQIAFGVLFAMLLLPSTLTEWKEGRARASNVAVRSLSSHPRADIRRVAVEALGFRGQTPERLEQVRDALGDSSPEVVAAASEVLARWSGLSAQDRPGLERWAQGELEKR